MPFPKPVPSVTVLYETYELILIGMTSFRFIRSIGVQSDLLNHSLQMLFAENYPLFRIFTLPFCVSL